MNTVLVQYRLYKSRIIAVQSQRIRTVHRYLGRI